MMKIKKWLTYRQRDVSRLSQNTNLTDEDLKTRAFKLSRFRYLEKFSVFKDVHTAELTNSKYPIRRLAKKSYATYK